MLILICIQILEILQGRFGIISRVLLQACVNYIQKLPRHGKTMRICDFRCSCFPNRLQFHKSIACSIGNGHCLSARHGNYRVGAGCHEAKLYSRLRLRLPKKWAVLLSNLLLKMFYFGQWLYSCFIIIFLENDPCIDNL